MGLGAGAIKSNVSPLIAEQYSGKIRKKVLKSGETVIISPALTYQRIYMYFYAAINLGSTAAISASFIARDHGYWVAFLVPTIVFAIVPIVLLLGKRLYVRTPPRGSIILEVRFSFVFAFIPSDCSLPLPDSVSVSSRSPLVPGSLSTPSLPGKTSRSPVSGMPLSPAHTKRGRSLPGSLGTTSSSVKSLVPSRLARSFVGSPSTGCATPRSMVTWVPSLPA